MGAIVGESLFYEVSRICRGTGPISYYQYKSLDSFAEAMAFHDCIALFRGEESDTTYFKSFDWLINDIHERTDCRIDIVSPKQRGQYIKPETMALFEQICRELYARPLGITSDDLFAKQRKDRTAEDMSERIEQLFTRNHPDFDCKQFGEGIYEILQKNANSSELLYFLRAHLFQAIAELQDLTPIYENQRLIAAIFHQKCRKENRVGVLSYAIYKMADSLFTKTHNFLPNDKKKYPRVSILMNAIIEGTHTRDKILDTVFQLREELAGFRHSYKEAEEVINNPDNSLFDRAETQRSLEESVREIWMPVIASLGRNYSSSSVWKVTKNVFGKYGVGAGELKLAHEEKKDSSENKATYSTPSLIGIATALAQSVSDVYRESKLISPNRALLDMILRVARFTNIKSKASTLLPVRGFNYRLPRLIDSLLVVNFDEASR